MIFRIKSAKKPYCRNDDELYNSLISEYPILKKYNFRKTENETFGDYLLINIEDLESFLKFQEELKEDIIYKGKFEDEDYPTLVIYDDYVE